MLVFKGAEYVANSDASYAFVSTNSITLGEQVSILWNNMLNKYSENIFLHILFLNGIIMLRMWLVYLL